ncbi:MAG: hypothetical protein UR69_C0003G0100 [Candidatus Moranbacteria bacterium GW2011_GWE2_35_2-]|nr:MAG: hypothetical protein UR69_C0003G0100 [Candidatus Moranbacteria bacterium GW2011_GWE2_35_2-]KKQ22119.1 MAG: hypothetical protein US37_C0004G0078 [Candidatus Moranbacteria bacterium GW2011_GWF2_37_11]KKQ29129.1 MAG: hypothetical protein US44_C0003G0041 [Candidatus Moranbacteria bacterium GW2011_GWD1_37_17]KKQ31114.1 MAG: hypothetical protein US47_C0001G0347 [Candidatus Moranbacteria bacterium GW2011_GWE1_37_24]KKQ47536.1 MAG: hypothetical protein US66_C0010G0013 [Candidatus Moranbacteria 
MKKNIVALLVSIFVCAFGLSANADEACFDPNAQYFDVNGVSRLNLWGIPEANDNAVFADARQSWHTELSVAMWYATILKAQENDMVVVVGYDPASYELWYVAKPRPTCP